MRMTWYGKWSNENDGCRKPLDAKKPQSPEDSTASNCRLVWPVALKAALNSIKWPIALITIVLKAITHAKPV